MDQVNGDARLASRTRITDRAPRDIPVRRPAFAFEKVKTRHWFGGDAFQTQLAHALSLTFPEGERFFMDAVRHYVDRVKSPALRHEISRFLAQEGMHGRAHTAFNEWIRSLGNVTESIERHVREDLAQGRKDSRPIERLAVTCALEHFTAMLAELLLSSESLREEMHPDVRDLWIWHAIEETEHKAVAFDTFVEVGGTYRLRVIAMLLTTASFVYRIADYQSQLLANDPEPAGPFVRLRGFVNLWIWPGKLLPVLPAYFDYYRPNFHPWQRKPHPKFDELKRAMDAYEPGGRETERAPVQS
ncbi:MAG TPA: metal-dependent hydrolase, partial [Polyangiaceae bacterium]